MPIPSSNPQTAPATALTSTEPPAPGRAAGGFFGPRVVRAAFVLAMLGWGFGLHGPAVFLSRVVERTGWPVDRVSMAVTLHYLVGAAVIVLLPRLYRRFGLAPVTAVAALTTALGTLGWALSSELWQLFAAAAISGAGWVGLGAVALNAIVSPWYVRGRPAALSSAYNGASFGGIVFAPLWVFSITWLGFGAAAALLSLVMIAVVFYLCRRVFRFTPAALGQAPDDDPIAPPVAPAATAPATGATGATGVTGATMVGEPPLPGWRDRAFVSLVLGMALGLFAQVGLIAHLVGLLAPALGVQLAGLLLGGSTICAIAGRSVSTRLLARGLARRTVAAGFYALQALGVGLLIMLPIDQLASATLAVGLFGLGIGTATSLPPLIAQRDFATELVPRVVARTIALAQATYAFAPATLGLLLARYPAAEPGKASTVLLFTVLAIQLLAAAAFLAGRRTSPAPYPARPH